MTVQEVQRQMQKQPFEPFRVLTADCQSYDVRHPEHLAFSGGGGKGRRIAIGMDDDSFVTLDLPLVTAIHWPILKERPTRRKAG